jgi:hypothetical protein
MNHHHATALRQHASRCITLPTAHYRWRHDHAGLRTSSTRYDIRRPQAGGPKFFRNGDPHDTPTSIDYFVWLAKGEAHT